MKEYFCPFRGLHYFYHQWERYSVWAHSTQIMKSYAGTIRVLVIIADKGPEVWALVQVMAVYFGFRIFYQPDPLHGLGAILGQAINTDPVYYSVAIGVVYVSKYSRAPYGSHKFFKAAQAAVVWWLKYYHVDDPLIEEFVFGFAEDLDESVDGLRQNWARLRRILREFSIHPSGPGVELRRWLTWNVS